MDLRTRRENHSAVLQVSETPLVAEASMDNRFKEDRIPSVTQHTRAEGWPVPWN